MWGDSKEPSKKQSYTVEELSRGYRTDRVWILRVQSASMRVESVQHMVRNAQYRIKKQLNVEETFKRKSSAQKNNLR